MATTLPRRPKRTASPPPPTRRERAPGPQRPARRPPDPPRPRWRPATTLPAGRVLLVALVAFALGLLLNAQSLDSKAHQLPYGWRRTLAIDVMGPIRAVAEFTRLDRPRAWLEEAIGKEGTGGSPQFTPATTAGTVSPSATAATTATTLPPVALRHPTAAEPLRLWVGGDSMTQVFGESLLRMAVDRGDISATLDYRISSGLSRPDYFDWPAHLRADVLTGKPEVVVIMFGANDSQPLNIDGTVRNTDEPEWEALYRERVDAAMDELRGDGRLVLWIGQPVMRDGGFSNRMARLDTIYQEEAASRPWIRFLDTRPLFAGSDGGYSAYLPDGSGDPTLMRQSDGIHLSRAGGDRLARFILETLDGEIAALAPPLPAAAPSTSTATTPG